MTPVEAYVAIVIGLGVIVGLLAHLVGVVVAVPREVDEDAERER